MTRQMSKGSQVAFAKAWLERQGIEAQTVDVQSYIDSSLSYEENIKILKQMLGMSGRSTQKATRTMSAAECDVAIGNCQAGFVEDCRDACKCGDPDACDVKVPRKRANPRTKIKKKKTSGVKPQKTTKRKRSSQRTVSGSAVPQKRRKTKKAKRCTRVHVKAYTRKCPTRHKERL